MQGYYELGEAWIIRIAIAPKAFKRQCQGRPLRGLCDIEKDITSYTRSCHSHFFMPKMQTFDIEVDSNSLIEEVNCLSNFKVGGARGEHYAHH